ncbi:MAG: hypothetical protein KatS3mg031_2995 [Chitinophagales bacterium]|nr:MAG: hypothetical protein KatS3mg031_2995 [Chitinophagales bacterium]
MAKVLRELLIRIGGDIKPLERAMSRAAYTIRRDGERLSRLGNELSLTVTAPILGLGYATIKAAGDIQSMIGALESTMGSAEAARREVELLRKAALAPGLDFEQALKGSVRLQAVGLDAELARQALSQFGNALALAGGSSEALDGVTLALTQIAAKGKVMAQEINQLAERVPQIRQAMKGAFGTADTEELQKMHLTTEQFVRGVIAELSKLPRATGGINNSLTNLGVSLKTSLARIGLAINSAFDIEGKINKAASLIEGIADKFLSLSESTQKNIIAFVAFAAAVGPAAKVLGVMKMLSAQVIEGLKGFIVALASLRDRIFAAAAAFMRLNIVMQASVLGAIAAAVGLAVVAFNKLKASIFSLNAEKRALANISSRTAEIAAEERVRVQRLADVIRSETSSRREKINALNELKNIAPEYFGTISTERDLIQQTNQALELYLKNIEARARAHAAMERLVEIEKKLIDIRGLSEEAKPSLLQSIGNAVLSLGDTYSFASRQAETFAKNLQQLRSELEAEREALKKIAADAEAAAAKAAPAASGTPAGGKGTGRKKVQAPALLPSIMDKKSALIAAWRGIIAEFEAAAPRLNVPFVVTSNRLEELGKQLEAVELKAQIFGQSFDPVTEKINLLRSAISQAIDEGAGPLSTEVEFMIGMLQELEQRVDPVAESFRSIGDAMQEAAKAGAASMRELGKAALKAAADVVRAKLMSFVATVIEKTAQITGPLAAILAPAAGAAAGVAFNAVIKALKIPALAQGGLAFAPSLAVVGDNPGASVDPEVIAPLSKLEGMLPRRLEVTGRLVADGSQLGCSY